MATGYFLTSITQQAWPIVTGGMPIVTNWSNLIIIFELTMLGAVFASVITLLVFGEDFPDGCRSSTIRKFRVARF